MRKTRIAMLAVGIGSAIAALLPVTSAGAAVPGAHIAVAATGQVVGVTNPNPADPFGVVTGTGGQFVDLEMGGAFTSGTAACAGLVKTVAPISFSTPAQNFLLGYGTIGSGSFTPVTAPCTSGSASGILQDGAFVRVGTVAIAQFHLVSYINGGDLVASFIGSAVPGGPPCPVGSIATCSGIAGPVVG